MQQLKHFERHFEITEKYKLPLFLHSRNAEPEFSTIMKKNRARFTEGVVHSFTGTSEELKVLLDLDLYIGE